MLLFNSGFISVSDPPRSQPGLLVEFPLTTNPLYVRWITLSCSNPPGQTFSTTTLVRTRQWAKLTFDYSRPIEIICKIKIGL